MDRVNSAGRRKRQGWDGVESDRSQAVQGKEKESEHLKGVGSSDLAETCAGVLVLSI